jgi:anti-anti-sigma factor
MKLDIYRDDNLVIIRIIGRFDINEVHNFETAFISQVESNPEAIAIKLKDCTYIDSSAIVSFVRFKNLALKNKIDIIYYGLNDNINRIFSISKLDTYLKVLSEEEFLEQYSRK